MEAERRSRGSAQPGDLPPVLAEALEDPLRGVGRRLRRVDDTLEEELEPCLPVPREPDLLEQLVVALRFRLKYSER